VTAEHSSSHVYMFIRWLNRTMRTSGVTSAQLGQYLGAGNKDKIDEDLSGAYLPSWGYVQHTYLRPIEKISKTRLSANTIAEGKQLYKNATLVATPSLPGEGIAESYSRVVAPLLAGLSLPAIVALATAKDPDKPSREIALSFLIMATGLFLASFQLTIGPVYMRTYHWGMFRAGLSVVGILFLIVALSVLIGAVAGWRHWWVVIVVVVLGAGGITQLVAWVSLNLLTWYRSRRLGLPPAKTAITSCRARHSASRRTTSRTAESARGRWCRMHDVLPPPLGRARPTVVCAVA
jgi:hypothetical protein